MNEIAKTRVDEIVTLHNEIGGALKMTLEKAIRIGELLEVTKAELEHGEFGPWVDEHLPFTDRTARNYMNLYRNRERLKTETVSDLTEAYKLLEEPTGKETTEKLFYKPSDNIFDNIIRAYGVEPHTTKWDITEIGVVFKADLFFADWEMLIKNLGPLRLPGDKHLFIICDILNGHEKQWKQAKADITEFAKENNLTIAQVIAGLPKWIEDFKVFGLSKGWKIPSWAVTA